MIDVKYFTRGQVVPVRHEFLLRWRCNGCIVGHLHLFQVHLQDNENKAHLRPLSQLFVAGETRSIFFACSGVTLVCSEL